MKKINQLLIKYKIKNDVLTDVILKTPDSELSECFIDKIMCVKRFLNEFMDDLKQLK